MSRQLSQKEFEMALHQLNYPKGRQLQFLKLHAQAKGRVSTMRRLAEKVGYKSWRGMNLQYGLLAREIGSVAGIKNPDITLLVEFISPTTRSDENISNSEWILVMREPFAKALMSSGWI